MLSIIIPVYALKKEKNLRFFYKKRFGIQETIESLVSVLELENIRYEIIMVINNSSDNELINYIKNHKNIKKYVIQNVNVGVARAWNIGANLAEFPLMCFCNDDVEFSQQSINNCINAFAWQDKIGQVGPEGGNWHLDKSGERLGIKEYALVQEISGYFFITSREAFNAVGGFDINYTPAGVEEIDYSFALRSVGYKCVVVPNTGITHHGEHGISNATGKIIKFFDKEIDTITLDKKNKEYFVKKWYESGLFQR